MQSIAVFLGALAIASAASVYQLPTQNSAVIESHRVGGNFAYRTSEGQAYGIVNPVAATSYNTVPVQTIAGYQQYQPAVTGYQTVAGYQQYQPITTGYTGYQTVNSVPVSTVGNVADVKTGYYYGSAVPAATTYVQQAGANYVSTVPAATTYVQQAGTPASTVKTLPVTNYNYGYNYGYPYQTVVV